MPPLAPEQVAEPEPQPEPPTAPSQQPLAAEPQPIPARPLTQVEAKGAVELSEVRYEEMKALVIRCWQDLKYVKGLWGNTYIERAEREVADRMKDLGIIT